MSYCGLNHIKYRKIFDNMIEKGFNTRIDERWGARLSRNLSSLCFFIVITL